LFLFLGEVNETFTGVLAGETGRSNCGKLSGLGDLDWSSPPPSPPLLLLGEVRGSFIIVLLVGEVGRSNCGKFRALGDLDWLLLPLIRGEDGSLIMIFVFGDV
jgi:hypothetical protein